ISQLTLSASAYGTAHIGAAIADGEVITGYPPGYEPDDSIYFDSTANYDETYYYTGNKYGKSE
ncbi:phage tail protein I, partial [Escherichia coli]